MKFRVYTTVHECREKEEDSLIEHDKIGRVYKQILWAVQVSVTVNLSCGVWRRRVLDF